MSAAALSDHSKVIGTPDELESFFHVLLYNSVRYLKSNCMDAGTFIEQFFDTYTVCQGKYGCGLKKQDAIKSAELVEGPVKGVLQRLRFNTPLDDFLDEALGWFRAHYIVQAYRAEQAPPSKTSMAPPTSVTPPSSKPRRRAKPRVIDFYAAQTSAPASLARKIVPIARKPTAEEEEDALKVASHTAILDSLYKAIYSDDWAEESDRADGDNVPPTFVPFFQVGPGPRASKRRKTTATPIGDDDEDAFGDVYPLRKIIPGATPRTPRARRRPEMKHYVSALL